MLAYSVISPIFSRLLNTGLVKKIYHTVHLHAEGDERFPVYRVGDDFMYAGQDDTKIMGCYIRQTGDMVNQATEQVTSQEKMYRARVPYRIVFFNDHEDRNHDDLAAKLMGIVFEDNIEFVRWINDKTRLAIDESKLKGFNFGGETFYAAIDFIAIIKFKRNDCEEVMGCGEIDNPIIKC